MPIGSVARFDCRRGYGFVIPDDGGEDIFVHQNNIEMEGFRFLQPGERVNYELEVGEKGMKAVSVALVEPRPASEDRRDENDDGSQEEGDRRPARSNRKSSNRKNNGGGNGGGNSNAAASNNADTEKLEREVEKLRRKQERLISILVEKGIMQPGEIDGPVAEPLAETAEA